MTKSEQMEEKMERVRAKLNPEQRKTFDSVVQRIQTGDREDKTNLAIQMAWMELESPEGMALPQAQRKDIAYALFNFIRAQAAATMLEKIFASVEKISDRDPGNGGVALIALNLCQSGMRNEENASESSLKLMNILELVKQEKTDGK